MADPPPNPEQPPQQPSGSPQEHASVQFRMPPEAELGALRSQEMVAGQGWPQGAGLGQYEEPPGSLAYQGSDLQRQPYLDEDRAQAHLMLEQLQQGQGSLFQQLESAFQDAQPDALGPYNAYQREEQQFQPYGGAQHGPYMRDDPSFQFSPSELGFMPFDMEVSELEPRELAVQNAKAYLLQTSISCDLSL